jgi:diguanylate cyclase (GGDEF)-like protein
MLTTAGAGGYEFAQVRRLDEALKRLHEEEFDLALIDLSLPDAVGLDALNRVQAAAPSTPIIVLSGTQDEPLALRAVKAGAQDYLVKGQTDGGTLHRAIRYAIERKRAEEQLAFLSHHDALTGLGNRAYFRETLSRAMARARHKRARLAVLFLDLDRFKVVNDSLGHDAGDELLDAVAVRLRGCLRDFDSAARIGGDEFAVILEDLRNELEATAVAQKILEAAREPYRIEGHPVVVTGSVGLAFFPENGEGVAELVKSAEWAVYRAKENGRNCYQLASPDAHAQIQQRLRLESELRRALDRREFVTHYQPQLRQATRELLGFEALLRWQHQELGLVPPMQFIPLLEESGLIVQVGDWVLRTACAHAELWRREQMPGLRVAVNLSARQFEDSNLVDVVARALHESGLPPDCLELEITESLLMRDTERTMATLAELKARGIRIALDDFGTGYSSLAYLKKFPLDSLKIDRSFVKDITRDADDASIAAAIIGLGRNLRLEVIAEGVETEEQLRALEGCHGVQGYLFGKPEPPERIRLAQYLPESPAILR